MSDDATTTPVDEAWAANRKRLVSLAYRMTGSLADAEDVVQEAFVRYSRNRHLVDDPTAWLVTTTTRLCLDHLKSADVARRAYVGPWLPEPIVEPIHPVDPQDRITLDESVRMALLVALQELSPAERTALILHDAFQLPFDEIAELVGRSPDACRQLASRARRHLERDAPPRFDVSADAARRIATQFANACETGDIDALARVLDPDAVGVFDSGGRIPGAPLDPILGRDAIAHTLAATVSGRPVAVADVNGEPGVVITAGPRVAAVISIIIVDGLITDIHAVGNPDKLRAIRP